MKYYIRTTEQILSEGALAEYGGTERVDDEPSALSKYYKKLSDVSADIGKNHTYMNIEIRNSVNGFVKSEEIGTYQNDEESEEG